MCANIAVLKSNLRCTGREGPRRPAPAALFKGLPRRFRSFLALLSKKQKLLDIPQPKGQLNVAQQNGAELIRGSTGVAQVEKSYRGGFYLPDATFPSLDGYCWLDTLTLRFLVSVLTKSGSNKTFSGGFFAQYVCRKRNNTPEKQPSSVPTPRKN